MHNTLLSFATCWSKTLLITKLQLTSGYGQPLQLADIMLEEQRNSLSLVLRGQTSCSEVPAR
jgi:hypothetical protein